MASLRLLANTTRIILLPTRSAASVVPRRLCNIGIYSVHPPIDFVAAQSNVH